MLTLATFELEVHERVEKGAPVNADILIGLCADLFQEGYGDAMEFDLERAGITWAQFGHLYANFFRLPICQRYFWGKRPRFRCAHQ